MSKVGTFIAALKTGETRTTRALERVIRRRAALEAAGLAALLNQPGALDKPLQAPLRTAVKKAPLPERYIAACIDGWPDAKKEEVRRALAKAIRDGRTVRFRWGLTAATGCDVDIHNTGTGAVTITALSPRSTLRVNPRHGILVAPR
ncbi:MAG: hypothetical protein M3P30_03960 [Chloroflexota bacterium]|nr:hypothetical protein [Chloroflexota bacterium]